MAQFSKRPPSFIWTGRVIMHVDMNAFFPTCEEIRDPSLRGKPHAVIMTPEREGNVTRGAVASCHMKLENMVLDLPCLY